MDCSQKQCKGAGNDMKMFLIVFALALLFVIGSAGMMRYFDGKSAPKKEKGKKDTAYRDIDD